MSLFHRFAGYGLALLAFLISAEAGFGQTNTVLTTLGQVQALTLDEARKGHPVKVRASVTYSDPEWMMMFVQDGSGSTFVERNRPYNDPSWSLLPGHVVLLEGVTSAGLTQANVRETKFEMTDEMAVLVPKTLDGEAGLLRARDTSWVKASGVIIDGIGQFQAKSQMWLRTITGQTLKTVVLGGDSKRAEGLRGYVVEVTGVLGLDLDKKQKMTGTNTIWVPGFAWVRKVRPISLGPIAALPEPPVDRPSGLPGHIRGVVTNDKPGLFLFLRDDSGSVRVNFDAPMEFRSGSTVEVIGIVERQQEVVVLNHSMVLGENPVPDGAVTSAAVTAPVGANTNLQLLTKVVQVRSLSVTEALRAHPVRVTGVVIFSDPQNSNYFVQDNTGGIYVDIKRKPFDPLPKVRQWVEVLGFSGPGQFAPVIEPEELRVLSDGDFPPPNPAGLWTLMTGSQDSQWVMVNGVVRHQTLEDNNYVLTLSSGESTIKVIVPDGTQQPAPANFEDAYVEIQGVCATDFDANRRLQNIEFLVPEWNLIRVLDAAPRDVFGMKARPLGDLLRFQAEGGVVHRAHVAGTVGLCREDGSFYVQDPTGGVRVQPERGSAHVKVGDEVELVGFPSVLDKLPVLQNAVVKLTGRSELPKPLDLSSEMSLRDVLNGRLVELQGTVQGHFRNTAQESLSLESGSWIIDAVLEKDQPADRLARILPGSVVRATGIFVPRLGEDRQVLSFQLWLRSLRDITVLSRPSWWSARHTLWTVVGFGLVLAWALISGSLLRRQVRQRTHQLREEIEERKRMEVKMAATHEELVTASRHAGMAEVATGVLHNVGNVLNSVNVSAQCSWKGCSNRGCGRWRGWRRRCENMRAIWGSIQPVIPKEGRAAYLGQLAGNCLPNVNTNFAEGTGIISGPTSSTSRKSWPCNNTTPRTSAACWRRCPSPRWWRTRCG